MNTTQSIVVTVVEGRNFVKKHDHVYIQCRFNNEILTTDPVHQTATPIWDTELVWNIQHKQLSYLRSVRAKLKLLVYSINIENQREEIGFVILDLRAASNEKAEKWYPLINIKSVSPFRPELKLSFLVTSERQSIVYSPETKKSIATDATPVLGKSIATDTVPVARKSIATDAVPMVDQRVETVQPAQTTIPVSFLNGYYQINHYDPSQQFFTLFITISIAEHLSILSQQQSGDFYFYYQFLGVDIRTRSFSNLASPEFPAECISLSIRGHVNDIATLLTQIEKIIVYLCNGDVIIGICEVSLTLLAGKIMKMELSVEEYLLPLFRPDMEICVDQGGNVPSIGVSLALSVDVDRPPSPKKTQMELPVGNQVQPVDTQGVLSTPILKNPVEPVPVPAQSVQPVQPAQAPVQQAEVSPPVVQQPVQQQPLQFPPTLTQQQHTQQHTQDSYYKTETHTTTQLETQSYEYQDPPFSDGHQFRVSIELRSIRNIKIKSATVFFKYAYAPFGTSSPVMTHPALPIQQTQNEIILEHSYAGFEFVNTRERVWSYFESVPLVIQMWHRDENKHHVLLGECTVMLNELGECMERNIEGVKTRKWECWTPVVANNTIKASTVCDLRTIVTMEDFGSVEKTQDDGHPAEYEAALELEIWKQEQKKEFLKTLEEKESDLESRYEQEFRERDAKRQVELNQKLKEYQNLLENLEGLSEQLDKREFVVSKKERELLSKESELDLERVKLARQAEESQKRLEEHVQESAKILKKRVQDAEDNIVLANKERDAYRQKFLELEMKRSEKDVDAMEYQKQIQLLTQANKELEQKCLRLTQSRHELKKKYMGLHDHCQKYKNLLQEQYYKQDDKENKDLNSLKTDVDSLKSKVLDPQVKAEIDRLGREKSLLLQTGYDDNDPLVRDLTAKILSFNI